MTIHDVVTLADLIDDQLAVARDQPSGRHSVTLAGGREHDLRQTVIALTAGNSLHDHDSPGEATLIVLRGDVVFTTADDEKPLGEGDYMVIPAERHGLRAETDAAILLTVASRANG